MDKQTQWTLLDDIGGEPLEISGFENEEPDSDEQFAPTADQEEKQQ